MSQTLTTTASNSNYQSIFDNALEAYRRKTKKDLRSHPLLPKLQNCDSPSTVLAVLREQIPGFDQSHTIDHKLTNWLNPTVNVLYTFSATIGAGISLVYPPSGVIFTGIGVLLSTAKSVSDSQDALFNIFERIENFFRRLETYIDVPPTAGMTDIIVKIMTEVLSILAIATNEIKQSRARKYVKKLVGRTDIEDALGRLDRLTQEEVRMVATQGLKVTHEVDDKVQDVDDKVQRVENKVQQVADEIDNQNRNQLRKDLRNWLSPPDSSVNYNTATDAHHEGTSLWLIESNSFKNWKSSGSLLWIHGKPGSGKSVISSSIIQDIERISDTGSAYMAYFFFDFKDTGKQDAHSLLSSLVVQLSHQSDTLCDILFGCYLTHQSGLRQPSDRALIQCLEDMLRVPGQAPVYLIVDALDECPNTTGMPSSRDRVLALVKKLVELNLPNLRVCLTSRPEIDIRTLLEPLTSDRICLHDQSGQKKDIVDYVISVVYSDINMQRWRDEDKKMVIETLSERADGMFRWVFCQLEILRHCLPPSVRHILAELPETLDKTYERILEEIPKSNRVHAHRLLQCLTVAVRPLCVDELAEVLTIDFGTPGNCPKMNEDLRWEDQEQAVLSACSSLISVVVDKDSQIVQFSHFSVKEFLTSDRLAKSKIDSSSYHHIQLEAAHTVMAQACLGVLLRLDTTHVREYGVKNFPLAVYAARHFGDHVEFEDVFSRIQDGVDHLLDAHKSHFVAWLWLCPAGNPWPVNLQQLEVIPLYYVAQRGFRRLVDHLILKRPEDVTVNGKYGTPLHGALRNGHADVAQLFLGHNVDIDARDCMNTTPLHLAAYHGLLSVVRALVERNADINAQDSAGMNPLHHFTNWPITLEPEDSRHDVVRFLLDHGADVDAKDNVHSTPLHEASFRGHITAVQLTLKYGANVHARNKLGQTPLHRVLERLLDETKLLGLFLGIIRHLLEHGADVDALDNNHSTPLHLASYYGCVKAARLLLEHGASVHFQDNEGKSPLQVASMEEGREDETTFTKGRKEIRLLLLGHLQNEECK